MLFELSVAISLLAMSVFLAPSPILAQMKKQDDNSALESSEDMTPGDSYSLEGQIYQPFETSPLLNDIHNAIRKELHAPQPPARKLRFNANLTKNYEELWAEANSWASKTGVVDLNSPRLGEVLDAMKTAKIVKADVLTLGTQIKLLLTLEGGKEVIFKPILIGPEWSAPDDAPLVFGPDRSRAEVMGFYMSFLLNAAATPPAVTRTISLRDEVVPVATPDLLETIFEKNDTLCFYGKCSRCNKDRHVCTRNGLLEGVAIFKLMDKVLGRQESPWRRRYLAEPLKNWERTRDYCVAVRAELDLNVVLDVIDQAIYDFLNQNGDRHHFETDRFGTMIWLDNGKAFGNPRVDYMDILAPLYQCCIIRKRMLRALEGLRGKGYITNVLEAMPDIEKLVAKDHLSAIERRLSLVFATLKYCESIGNEYVVL